MYVQLWFLSAYICKCSSDRNPIVICFSKPEETRKRDNLKNRDPVHPSVAGVDLLYQNVLVGHAKSLLVAWD